MRAVSWLGIVAFFVMSQGTFAQDIELRLHGSNTVGSALAPALVAAWAEDQGFGTVRTTRQAAEEIELTGSDGNGRRLRVAVHSHGSNTGYADMVAGRAGIWMSSRPVNRSEVERASVVGRLDNPDQGHVIALDGLAIVVAPGNPVDQLDVMQVQGMFSGRIRDWAEVGGRPGPIRLYARDDKSGTFDSFKAMVLGDQTLRNDARRFESNVELTSSVAADPNGLGFAGLAAVGSAKPLAVSAEQTLALLPEAHAVSTEDYLLARRLFFYHADNPDAVLRSLIDFALSEAGQRVVERIGYVPLRIAAQPENPRPGAPAEYAQLVQGAERVSLNFRFGGGLSVFDSKAERDVERLMSFMQNPVNANRQLIIVGFADTSEGPPFMSLSFSNDRVDYVAQRLSEVGLRTRGVVGFGGAAPVAPNSTELGRLKNRRVEVWLR